MFNGQVERGTLKAEQTAPNETDVAKALGLVREVEGFMEKHHNLLPTGDLLILNSILVNVKTLIAIKQEGRPTYGDHFQNQIDTLKSGFNRLIEKLKLLNVEDTTNGESNGVRSGKARLARVVLVSLLAALVTAACGPSLPRNTRETAQARLDEAQTTVSTTTGIEPRQVASAVSGSVQSGFGTAQSLVETTTGVDVQAGSTSVSGTVQAGVATVVPAVVEAGSTAIPLAIDAAKTALALAQGTTGPFVPGTAVPRVERPDPAGSEHNINVGETIDIKDKTGTTVLKLEYNGTTIESVGSPDSVYPKNLQLKPGATFSVRTLAGDVWFNFIVVQVTESEVTIIQANS